MSIKDILIATYLTLLKWPKRRLIKALESLRTSYTELESQVDKLKEENARLKIFAVDDSTMILNIYRTVLHNLGIDSEIFQFPAEALDKIKNEKPDVILTDLNMPEITGIDLTRNVREWYTKDKLPIMSGLRGGIPYRIIIISTILVYFFNYLFIQDF